MTMLKFCAARAMATSSLTGASLFRETDAHHWTVLWDEADNAFHKNSNPELIGVFNAGHDRYFAIVHRQVPSPDGGYETAVFDTFTGIAMTAIHEFPSKAMQSRCIVLIMKRATKEDAARLVDFDETHEAALAECGRKLMRWSIDLEALPAINKMTFGLINRIWLNWKPLLQIAQLAGGTWPARALAAAKADMARVTGEKDDSPEYALLAAIWRVLAADKSDPRRMLTLSQLIPKLLDEDEGRWRTAKNGKEIDEYYLRSKLKSSFRLRMSARSLAAGARTSTRAGTSNTATMSCISQTHLIATSIRGCPRANPGQVMFRSPMWIRNLSQPKVLPGRGVSPAFIRPSVSKA